MIGHATDHTMSPLAVQLVVTGHDQLHDLTTGRMTGLPSHIKRCTSIRISIISFKCLNMCRLSIQGRTQYWHLFLCLFCGICVRGVQLLWQQPAVVVTVNAGGAAWTPVFKVAPMPWWCALFQNQPPFIIPAIGHATNRDNLWLVVQPVTAICDWCATNRGNLRLVVQSVVAICNWSYDYLWLLLQLIYVMESHHQWYDQL